MNILGNEINSNDIAVFSLVFLALLAFGGFFTTVNKPKRGRRYRRAIGYRTAANANGRPYARETRTAYSDNQLDAVRVAAFDKKSVLSNTEARVRNAAVKAIADAGLGWQVMAQVSLGEILTSRDETAYFAINSKRVDLLIMSENREPLAVIEYQGQGHYQGTYQTRDAIKKEALEKAGIKYIEIKHGQRPADVSREVKRLASLFGLRSNNS